MEKAELWVSSAPCGVLNAESRLLNNKYWIFNTVVREIADSVKYLAISKDFAVTQNWNVN
jgi:hypothetical protein